MSSPLLLRPEPRPEILAIEAYVPGRSRVPGAAKIHKLSSNESPLGPSPKAIDAFRACASDLALYPDGSALALREAIGRRYGLDPARIICGNGSDELLALLAYAFLGPGDEGLYSEHGFLEYPICIRAAGGAPVVAKETDKTVSVDAMLAKVSARTKIVYLANPSNPTGTYIPFSEVKRLQVGLPSGRAIGDRRRLRGICDEERLRRRRRTRFVMRERRNDPNLFQNPRSRELAHRLGLWPCSTCSTRSIAFAGHST